MPLRIKMRVVLAVAAAVGVAVLLIAMAIFGSCLPCRALAGIAALSWIVAGVIVARVLIPQWDPVLQRMQRRHRGEQLVALTFDDGPDEPWTERILDILKAESVAATFFVLANKARAHPELVRRMIDDGHEVGNHTVSHRILAHRSRAAIEGELTSAQKALASITGARPHLFRAPHGFMTARVRHICQELGLTPIPWTRGLWDTDGADASMIIARLGENLGDPEILLLHDGLDEGLTCQSREATVAALSNIIRRYRDRGYRFVRISTLLDGKTL